MSATVKKIIKIVLCVIALVGAVGFIYHFILGIYRSCVNPEDVITAQDRVKSAYQFIYMICAGLVMLAGLIPQSYIKEHILPEKIRKLFYTTDKGE